MIAKLQNEILRLTNRKRPQMDACIRRKRPEITTMHPSESVMQKLIGLESFLDDHAIPQPQLNSPSLIMVVLYHLVTTLTMHIR